MPADPDRLSCSQSQGWFGQVVPRSDDGSSKPGNVTRVWHLLPSVDDPGTVTAGVEDAVVDDGEPLRLVGAIAGG